VGWHELEDLASLTVSLSLSLSLSLSHTHTHTLLLKTVCRGHIEEEKQVS